MPIDQVANVILGPQGDVLRDLRQKDVTISRDPMERVTFARMHTYAQRYGIRLVCQRCDNAIIGQNNDGAGQGAFFVVSCRCREWRFPR
jgi:hypothetical protein